MQTQDLSMHQEQHTNISTEVHNQLMMLSQQVSHVMQQQQQNNTSNFVQQVLNVQTADNSAELNVLRNITDSAIHHAQATSAQAQQVVAAVQEQAAQAVRASEQVLMSNAQQAMHTYEAQLNENAARFTQQHISQAEQDMNARFELRMNEMRVQMQHEFERQMECAQQQARAAKELAQQQITSLQQELHSVKTQHRLNATAISHPHTPERLSPCLPPGLLQEGQNRSPLQPAAQRMDSPDRLRDWYREGPELLQPRVNRSLLLEECDARSVHSNHSQRIPSHYQRFLDVTSAPVPLFFPGPIHRSRHFKDR
jgi:hypothetical protein